MRKKDILQLTDKEFYCLSWHYNAFYEQAKHKKIADYAQPCETCKYKKQCFFETKNPIVNEMEKKLPIQIIKHIHQKDIFSLGKNN